MSQERESSDILTDLPPNLGERGDARLLRRWESSEGKRKSTYWCYLHTQTHVQLVVHLCTQACVHVYFVEV
jgi:hypothetical protein